MSALAASALAFILATALVFALVSLRTLTPPRLGAEGADGLEDIMTRAAGACGGWQGLWAGRNGD